VVPGDTLDRFGPDAVRWRAAMTRPGTDTPFDEGQMRVGRRLAVKLLNVAKFVLGFGVDARDSTLITEPLDLAAAQALRQTIEQTTAAFEAYDYTRALETTERYFWTFCDDYVELVKQRAYGDDADPRTRSARATLLTALDVLLRLFAPIMPYVTEEAWSWWRDGSIHRAPWPSTADLGPDAGDAKVLEIASTVLSRVRGAKSDAKVSMRAEVSQLTVEGSAELVGLARAAAPDLLAAGQAADVTWIVRDTDPGLTVEV